MKNQKTRKEIERKTGYHCWLYGIKSWHRSKERAINKAIKNSNWCQDAQVIDVATWERVY